MPSSTRRAARVSRVAACFIVIGGVLSFLACRDVTAPEARPDVPPRSAALASAAVTVVVTPDSMQGWSFHDDQIDAACSDVAACRLVSGPTGAPSGTGSGELATASAADEKSLVLAAYAGVRLDQLTELRYSSFRQTHDRGNKLAIALQLNVDYDLGDRAGGGEGRIVFEPYRGNEGSVSDTTWQRWDARAGLWWGTNATVIRKGLSTANPCVQATPCTWAALLAAFPDIGVHRTHGAIILKAGSNRAGLRGSVGPPAIPGREGGRTRSPVIPTGSNWARFRGNVDQLTIAANGTSTTFDFERVRPPRHFRLRVVADDGVVFDAAMPRDTLLVEGTRVPFDLSAAAGRGTLLTVLGDTLAAPSGTIVMDRDQILYAETEAPIVPSAAVADLVTRIRAVTYSGQPRQALADFIAWYSAQSGVVGAELLRSQLDTAQFVGIDPVADSSALRAFDETVAGTEFVFSPYEPGAVYYVTPAGYGYRPFGATPGASMSPEATPAMSGSPGPALRGAVMGVPGGRTASAGTLDDEPDEPTHIVYVNGINTTQFAAVVGGASAAGTAENLRLLAVATSRFGLAGARRQNVRVSMLYNPSAAQRLLEYANAHKCEAQFGKDVGMRGRWHSLKRFANCKVIGFGGLPMLEDVFESMQQVIQLAIETGAPEQAAGHLAANIKWHHSQQAHAIVVGHSQGNLLIAQALKILPAIEPKPINVGNGCTAVLTLASPLPRASFVNVEPHYVRGLTVYGDVLQLLPLPANDFDYIHTPVGDSAFAPTLLENYLRVAQATRAHYVDENYLLYPPSAARVARELTRLSDECSAGTFSLAPDALQMMVRDTLRLGITLSSRTGKPLKGRDFAGRTDAGYVNGRDSSVVATNISAAPSTISVKLRNTAKVQASLALSVVKRPIIASINYEVEPYRWEVWSIEYGTVYSPPGDAPYPCGRYESTSDLYGSRTWRAKCRYHYSMSVKRADGGPVTFAIITPLELPPPITDEGALTSPVGPGPFTELLYSRVVERFDPADTRFEVKTYDGNFRFRSGLIGVDTVTAQVIGVRSATLRLHRDKESAACGTVSSCPVIGHTASNSAASTARVAEWSNQR